MPKHTEYLVSKPSVLDEPASVESVKTENLARRNFDIFTAGLLIVLMSPILLFLALKAKLFYNRVFDLEPVVGAYGRSFNLYRFAGLSSGRNFPLLFNIVSGNLAWVGEKPRSEHILSPSNVKTDSSSRNSAVASHNGINNSHRASVLRPGLVCQRRLQRLTGTYYEKHDRRQGDRDFGIGSSIAVIIRYFIARLMAPSYGSRCPNIVSLLGVDIHNHSVESALALIQEKILKKEKSQLGFVNPDCLNIAYCNQAYRGTLNNMSAVFADGIGLQIGCRIVGYHLKANVNGTDLFPLLCNQCEQNNQSIYLLGGADGVAKQAADNIKEKFPNLSIAGTHHGYFSEEETSHIIWLINQSKADILLVAFGAPKQDLWIKKHQDQLDTTVNIGVGGLFDFYAERISRSPRWLRDIGLEWTWRLLQEPKRMWRRYIIGNPLFLLRVWHQARAEPGRDVLKKFSGNKYGVATAATRYKIRHLAYNLTLLFSAALRRIIDVSAAIAALIVLSPLLVTVSVLIKLESPGPIIFKQKRVGKWGTFFNMYKFRSMCTDAEAKKKALASQNQMAGGVLFKMKEDPRITKIGRFIRKYSIDELPQLWNVAKGDMSLVGPRPPVPSEVDQYSLSDRRRLEIKPGITCLWQVSGRSEIPFDDQVELDVDYIESHGLWQDIKILLRTVPAVLMGKGAY